VFVEHDPNRKGNVAELMIAAEAAKLGIGVLQPMTEHGRFDLALEIGRRLIRVQCKWATRVGDVVQIRMGRSGFNRGRSQRPTYTVDEIDALAAYCDSLRQCYLLPAEMVAGKGMVHLRLKPTRNGQKAAVSFAAAYELGAVAQLAERVSGTHEAGGSNPPSSTPIPELSFPEPDTFSGLPNPVGMDEFDSKLGQYVRRAEAGHETVVTRWGRPVARLGPPA
jgi:PD-(D/E)XK endonuclease